MDISVLLVSTAACPKNVRIIFGFCRAIFFPGRKLLCQLSNDLSNSTISLRVTSNISNWSGLRLPPGKLMETSASLLSEQLAMKKNRKRCLLLCLSSWAACIARSLYLYLVNTFTTILVVSNWQAARTSRSENSLHSQVMSEHTKKFFIYKSVANLSASPPILWKNDICMDGYVFGTSSIFFFRKIRYRL
ncbi:hypothetical protein BDA96_09G211800 [Sorghum bicolor]|jgi:hypothetical protein|uniref:Uncharacterized protein n=2 Tax=Sorghum bicolor TaxID=4558 RepID=A0A921QBP4_SORBI|nr:hypothetical protein BDA96_09G211800 [Sorghum bicolor]OQU78315.1 hypothetical protein SORBI_3009G200750 [Sorghum bicolor]